MPRHEMPEGRDRARLVWDQRGVRLYDTQGMEVRLGGGEQTMAMGAAHQAGDGGPASSGTNRLYVERRACADCGIKIPRGAIYCRVDRPYGFWHWLKYFSAVRWAR